MNRIIDSPGVTLEEMDLVFELVKFQSRPDPVNPQALGDVLIRVQKPGDNLGGRKHLAGIGFGGSLDKCSFCGKSKEIYSYDPDPGTDEGTIRIELLKRALETLKAQAAS